MEEEYFHQYLTAVFRISLGNNVAPAPSTSTPSPIKVSAIVVEAPATRLTLSDFNLAVFDALMSFDNSATTKCQVAFDGRFTGYEDAESISKNPIHYLFKCYCRTGQVYDYENRLSPDQRRRIVRYIIEQIVFILACPFANSYYTEQRNAFDDLFAVLTEEYGEQAIGLMREITDEIVNVNGMRATPLYDSNLLEISPEELQVIKIVEPIYDRLLARLTRHQSMLGAGFYNDMELLNLLLGSPLLVETFLELNSPATLRGIQDAPATPRNSGAVNTLQGLNDLIRNTLQPSQSRAQESADGRNRAFLDDSALGILLSCSCLPSKHSPKEDKSGGGLGGAGEQANQAIQAVMNSLLNGLSDAGRQFQFYQNASMYYFKDYEKNTISFELHRIQEGIAQLVLRLLKSSPAARQKTLRWLQCVVSSYDNRVKIWQSLGMDQLENSVNLNDGMLINFSAVMLELCKPFCMFEPATGGFEKVNPKMLKIDPLYLRTVADAVATAPAGAVPDPAHDFTPFLVGLSKDYRLLSLEGHVPAAGADPSSANFITKCFFLTHKALYLGFRVTNERLMKTENKLGTLYERLRLLGINPETAGPNVVGTTPQQKQTLAKINQTLTVRMSLIAALGEPDYIESLLHFYISTAVWINNLAVTEGGAEQASASFAAIEAITSGAGRMPKQTSQAAASALAWMPEFIIENIIDFFGFVSFYKRDVLRATMSKGLSLLPLVHLVILFMGCPKRMYNPHLRGKLAKLLESLLPDKNEQLNGFSAFGNNMSGLFIAPVAVEHLLPVILEVFVNIEIGDEQGGADVVTFEQKFNYRQPIYSILKYCCTLEQYQTRLGELSREAEGELQATKPPVFLRFVNLLINDAIYLLDESLSTMRKIKDGESRRGAGGAQNAQFEMEAGHLRRVAKFYNIMGQNTISTLTTLTCYVKEFFSDTIMVDRIAAMLNYFLFHLVGPQRNTLRVEDMSGYSFEPKQLVTNICKIYVNLGSSPDQPLPAHNSKYERFCLAVSQDERSYSPDLLEKAKDVLRRLSEYQTENALEAVGRTVVEQAEKAKRVEIPLEAIPDEFLDPIMGTLMEDPVTLPHSKNTLDRATITRHLSGNDQTDPYTRERLTLEMLVPNTELKLKIQQFLKDQQAAAGQARS